MGGKIKDNLAGSLISDYIYRKRLAKLGYNFDGENLDAWKAEGFLLIDSEIEKMREKVRKAEAAKQRSAARRKR